MIIQYDEIYQPGEALLVRLHFAVTTI